VGKYIHSTASVANFMAFTNTITLASLRASLCRLALALPLAFRRRSSCKLFGDDELTVDQVRN